MLCGWVAVQVTRRDRPERASAKTALVWSTDLPPLPWLASMKTVIRIPLINVHRVRFTKMAIRTVFCTFLTGSLILHSVGCATKGASQSRPPSYYPKEDIVADPNGNMLFASYGGFKTKTCGLWKGRDAFVSCIFLGNGPGSGLVYTRTYVVGGASVRDESLFLRNPMLLRLEERSPSTGTVMGDEPEFIHQEEAREYFESFVQKYELVRTR